MFATAHAQNEEREERVLVAGRLYVLDELAACMDSAILYEASEWAGTGASDQAIVDLYLRLHEKRHGLPFVPR